jgi:ankyrin repeat protein
MDLSLGKTSKAAVNTKGQGGRTLLSWAAMNGHVDVVELLLPQDNIDVELSDEDGETPLLLAIEIGF